MIARRPTCFKDLKCVGGKVYDSFMDACFEMRFFEDDKEYLEAIEESNDQGSDHFLRKLFGTMLLSSTTNRPRQVWERTWFWLCDFILYEQRNKSSDKGK